MDQSANDISQWLPEARTGSLEALGQLLETYRRYLLLIAEHELDSVLHAKGGASDLVQETFLEAQQAFPRFHGDSEEELRAWLRRLLLNNVANFTRRYQATDKRKVAREVPLETREGLETPGGQLPADTPSPSGEAVANEQAEVVRAVLGQLPVEYQQVLTWRYQEGRSFEEIGQRLGRTPNAARKLFARALERFEQELEKKQ
jgi:RNA polymerase sigma-70 factor (ECF subfamily)